MARSWVVHLRREDGTPRCGATQRNPRFAESAFTANCPGCNHATPGGFAAEVERERAARRTCEACERPATWESADRVLACDACVPHGGAGWTRLAPAGARTAFPEAVQTVLASTGGADSGHGRGAPHCATCDDSGRCARYGDGKTVPLGKATLHASYSVIDCPEFPNGEAPLRPAVEYTCPRKFGKPCRDPSCKSLALIEGALLASLHYLANCQSERTGRWHEAVQECERAASMLGLDFSRIKR